MAAKKGTDETQKISRARAVALGKALRELRESRDLSRAELLDKFYDALGQADIDYKIRGDWWLTDIETGEKAKQLPRQYIMAFIQALDCTQLEAIRLLVLADLNFLTSSKNNSYATGLSYVLATVFTNALAVVETQIDEKTAATLGEREWLVIGQTVLELVVKDLERHLKGT